MRALLCKSHSGMYMWRMRPWLFQDFHSEREECGGCSGRTWEARVLEHLECLELQ